MMQNLLPKTPLVVIGPDGSNPLGIIRSVGRMGIPVYLLSSNHSTLSRLSRYVKGGEYNVNFSEPAVLQRALESLLQKINQPAIKPLLVVTNEIHYTLLLPIYDYIKQHFDEITPAIQIAPFCEKEQQFPLAEQAGFRVSKTIVLQTKEDIKQVDSLQFPVIVKPRALHTTGGYKNKADLFDNIDALKVSIEPVFDVPETVLLAQEFVPGNDEHVVFFLASCGENGNVRTWVTGHKLRQYLPNRGVMTSGYLKNLPELAEKSKTLCRLFGQRGLIGVECKLHPQTGELFYIESSLRADAYNSICFSAKLNLVLDTYLAAHGLPCTIPQTSAKAGSWCDVSTDLDSARLLISTKNLTWKKYLKPLPRPISYAYFTWDDPLPFLRWLPLRFVPLFKKLFRLK